MSKEFLIGCNYWASHAGTDMWRRWDAAVVREDLSVLSSHGISTLRVFPNWRDFQPIAPIYTSGGRVREYRMEDGSLPPNPEYLDETMLSRFAEFCDICDEFGIRLIVGLITGFMSGQTFMPSALYGKPLFTDPFALLCQQRLIRGFVARFRDRETILSWDLGNECNNLGAASSAEEASNWSNIIANAIRAADPTRPVISGMHGLSPYADHGVWTIGDQAEACDIMTTHPYPYFVPYADHDPILSMRTTLHATFETKFYSDIGSRPCLVEEIGTLGPMICSDEAAAAFMRLNLLSNRIHGAEGVLWWCANEQSALTHTPYCYCMCERELGMRRADGSPKPVLEETKRLAPIVQSPLFDLPKATEDAVCISTWDQAQWGVAYLTCCLATQAGLNLRYAVGDDIPKASVYLLPSVSGVSVMPSAQYHALFEAVREGATLYISNDSAFLTEFESLVGMKVVDSCVGGDGMVSFEGMTIPFTRSREYRLTPTTATVLATDEKGYPAVSVNTYGKGRVVYVNFPLEAMLLRQSDMEHSDYYKLYHRLFAPVIESKPVVKANPFVALTLHPDEDGSIVCAAVNHSAEPQAPQFTIDPAYRITETLYGDVSSISPFDACLFRIKLQ